MSSPTSTKSSDDPSEPQLYRKPRADIFTVLLIIALLAILLGTVLLWQVMKTYDYRIKGAPPSVLNRAAATQTIDV